MTVHLPRSRRSWVTAGLLVTLFGFLGCVRSNASGAAPQGLIPTAQGSDGYSYFPTGNTQDGHFLALSGASNATVSGTSVDIKLAAPGSDAGIEIGLFDGDLAGLWDTAGNTACNYELYANPNNGTLTDNAGNLNPGIVLLGSWSSSQMADNGWSTLANNGQVTSTAAPALTNAPAALSGSGNYFYILHCYLTNPTANALNAFRLRTRTPMGVAPANYGIYAPWNQVPGEELAYYPNYNPTAAPQNQTAANLAGTRYDGNWKFYLDVPAPQTTVGIWDGDFDHGGQNCYIDLNGNRVLCGSATCGDWDTRDADTTNFLTSTLQPGYSGPQAYVAQDVPTKPFLTWWKLNTPTTPPATPAFYPTSATMRVPGFAASNPGVLQEGIGIGTIQNVNGCLAGFHTADPPDDTAAVTGTGAPAANKVLLRPGVIYYNLIDPLGNSYANGNPSGNLEWERFTVTSDLNTDWHLADYGPGWGASTWAGNDAGMNGAQIIPQATPGITAGPQGLPAGVWTISINAMDIHNLNAIYPDFETLGVSLDGRPVAGIRPFTLQGRLLNDCNQALVAGIVVDLLDANGTTLANTKTLADGRYLFWVNPGTYTVVIDPSNFTSGGALYRYGTPRGASAQVAIAGANGVRDFSFQPPVQVSGPASLSLNTDPSSCGVTADHLPLPATSCSMKTLTNDAPSMLPTGTTVVTWTAGDAAGNTATLTQVITVKDNQAPTITAPPTVTLNTDAGKCTANAAGLPAPAVTDNCAGVSSSSSAPAAFPVGTTVVVYTATDVSGNTSSFSQTVTVVDQQLPVVTAPADVTVSTDAGKSTAGSVGLGAPVSSDNCGVKSVTNNAPATFPLGTTTVTWTATDNSGITATATQQVTVKDTENPTITAPVDVTANTDAGKCSAGSVNLGAPTAADNVAVKSVTSNAPASFAIGVTTVTWTVTDTSGNTANTTQKVTVTDNEKPVITAPANVAVTLDAGKSAASNVNLGMPATTDNCGVASVTNDAPATFPVGVTTVTWTATDASGNTSTATQVVTVTVAAPVVASIPSTASLGDRVWFDANGNGVQDAGEPGIANVTVKLYTSTGTLVATTTTNSTGDYSFTKLSAGSYYVMFTAPSGYSFTKQTQGADMAKDSDVDATGKTATVVLTADQNNATVDAGMMSSAVTVFTTYTQGGWGSTPNGSNPGMVLQTNFSRVYPGGSVQIGGANTLTFTSAAAIQAFLPQGGTAAALAASATNPTGTYSVLAGQLLALQLNVDFSNSGVSRPGLGSLTIQSGAFAGKTVSQFLTIANQAFGGASTGYNLSDINSTADSINQNFDNGTQNLGNLK